MHSFPTLDSLLEFGKEYLCSHSISNYQQESSWILLHVMQRNFTWMYSHKNNKPTNKEIDDYLDMIYKRADHIPLQLILGLATFYGRDFTIYPDVFIPRQDTETIIDVCKKKNSTQPLIYVQDLAALQLH
jgi:release factor glutamine methyltransferase